MAEDFEQKYLKKDKNKDVFTYFKDEDSLEPNISSAFQALK